MCPQPRPAQSLCTDSRNTVARCVFCLPGGGRGSRLLGSLLCRPSQWGRSAAGRPANRSRAAGHVTARTRSRTQELGTVFMTSSGEYNVKIGDTYTQTAAFFLRQHGLCLCVGPIPDGKCQPFSALNCLDYPPLDIRRAPAEAGGCCLLVPDVSAVLHRVTVVTPRSEEAPLASQAGPGHAAGCGATWLLLLGHHDN